MKYEEIKSYVENNRNAKLLDVNYKKGEYQYQPNDKNYVIKGYFENVEEWLKSLITIGEGKYQLAGWWKEKNYITWDLLQEGEMLVIKKETDKAMLITNNANTEVWIPKSSLKKIS